MAPEGRSATDNITSIGPADSASQSLRSLHVHRVSPSQLEGVSGGAAATASAISPLARPGEKSSAGLWYAVVEDSPRPVLQAGPGSASFSRLLTIADIVALSVGFLIADLISTEFPLWGHESGAFTRADFFHAGVFCAIALAVFRWQGLYRFRFSVSTIDEIPMLFRVILIAELIFVAGITLVAPGTMNPIGLIRIGLVSFVAVPLGRACVFAWEKQRRRAGAQRNVLLFGMGDVAQELAAKLKAKPEFGMKVVAFVDQELPPARSALGKRAAVWTSDLAELVEKLNVEQILVAFSRTADDVVLEVIRRFPQVQVSIVPRMFDITTSAAQVDQVSRFPFLTLTSTPCRGIGGMLKRLLDVLSAGSLVLLSLPILAFAAWRIKREDGGPIFFLQERLGKDGKPFRMVKFRTMVVDAEARKVQLRALSDFDSVLFKMKEDPRVTRIGRFLRRHSLDEIPQLFNVLKGDMSLIGPRPPLASEVNEYPFWFRKRLEVRPGITGLWQIEGRSDLDFAESTKIDLFYVEHWSMWLDLKISLRTIGVMVFAHGGY